MSIGRNPDAGVARDPVYIYSKKLFAVERRRIWKVSLHRYKLTVFLFTRTQVIVFIYLYLGSLVTGKYMQWFFRSVILL